VCLVIANLLYVYASAMFEFIEEMLPNFSNIFLFGGCMSCLVSSRGDCGFWGVTVGTRA
jgi:hypothetical protein